MLLIALLVILMWLIHNPKPNQYTSYRKPIQDTGFKYRKKPRWVINRIVEHKAFMPNAGCRLIAVSFNRRYGDREN